MRCGESSERDNKLLILLLILLLKLTIVLLLLLPLELSIPIEESLFLDLVTTLVSNPPDATEFDFKPGELLSKKSSTT